MNVSSSRFDRAAGCVATMSVPVAAGYVLGVPTPALAVTGVVGGALAWRYGQSTQTPTRQRNLFMITSSAVGAVGTQSDNAAVRVLGRTLLLAGAVMKVESLFRRKPVINENHFPESKRSPRVEGQAKTTAMEESAQETTHVFGTSTLENDQETTPSSDKGSH